METPVSLLDRLRGGAEADAGAWERFVQLYTPVVFRWLESKNCPPDEIPDLLQDVFLTLVKSIGAFQYDRSKSFGRWLRTVAINKWRDRLKQCKLPIAVGAGQQLDQLPDKEPDPFWEREYRAVLARRALEIMRGDFAEPTWTACWRIVVENHAVSEVAADLKMTEGAVRAAKFRVLDRLRRELAGLLD